MVDVKNTPVKPRSTFGSRFPPKKLPKGWRFAVDSNELAGSHRGYEMTENKLEPVVQSLFVGDYSIVTPDGQVLDRIASVERKSLANLMSDATQTSEQERMAKANARHTTVAFPAFVIEADHCDVATRTRPPFHVKRGRSTRRTMSPNAVVGTLIAWSLDNRIPAYECSNEIEGERITRWVLARVAWKIQRGEFTLD